MIMTTRTLMRKLHLATVAVEPVTHTTQPETQVTLWVRWRLCFATAFEKACFEKLRLHNAACTIHYTLSGLKICACSVQGSFGFPA